jgi:hypothetical protein
MVFELATILVVPLLNSLLLEMKLSRELPGPDTIAMTAALVHADLKEFRSSR